MALIDDFKDALACWATGVSVVATNEGWMLYGITVSSFTSVSLDPPLVLVCINNDNRMPEMILRSQRFSISILQQDQEEASNYFASPGREPTRGFVEIEGEFTVLRQPIVSDAMAHLVCELHEIVEAGSHSVVIGRVVHADGAPNRPLLYFNRGYRKVQL